MESPAPTLYHRWKCPWCAAVRQALENVGVSARLVEVPYERSGRTEVVAISGQPRVPMLVDGDEVVVDSRQIVRHLYARYGGATGHDFRRSIAELDQDIAAEEAERAGPGGHREHQGDTDDR
ncbi:MAG: glutathione S-transferase N-terminal domain-containing protein [Miltoncostaeaceae bacterium]